MFYVYILGLSNGKYYIGQTNNLDNRLIRHNTGQVRSTKAYRPVKMLYHEVYKSRAESMYRESYLKSLKSHKIITEIIHSGDGPVV